MVILLLRSPLTTGASLQEVCLAHTSLPYPGTSIREPVDPVDYYWIHFFLKALRLFPAPEKTEKYASVLQVLFPTNQKELSNGHRIDWRSINGRKTAK